MRKVREIVDSIGIEEKRMIRDENQRKMLAIKSLMSDLTRYTKVAQYANALSLINDDEKLLHKLFYLEQIYSVDDELYFESEADKKEFLKKLRRIMHGRNIEKENLNMMYVSFFLYQEKQDLEAELPVLEQDKNVLGYKILREEYARLERQNQEYYQAVNKDFPEALRETDLPNIFVYQGMIDRAGKVKLARHIILSDCCEAFTDTSDTIIYPTYEIRSKRNERKFYNPIRWRYLEQLSQDYDFDVKVKKLGNIEIR